jgi:hypothetical protein
LVEELARTQPRETYVLARVTILKGALVHRRLGPERAKGSLPHTTQPMKSSPDVVVPQLVITTDEHIDPRIGRSQQNRPSSATTSSDFDVSGSG